MSEDAWYHAFGHVLVVEALPNPGSVPTRLVYYEGGKVDFAIISATPAADETYEEPFRVLLDKDSVTSGFVIHTHPAEPPNPQTFSRVLNHYWAEALMCARAVARSDSMIAMMRCWNANHHLLRMVE